MSEATLRQVKRDGAKRVHLEFRHYTGPRVTACGVRMRGPWWCLMGWETTCPKCLEWLGSEGQAK